MNRLGAVLAVVALALRLLAPNAAPPPPTSASPAELAALFGEHALCLAAAGAIPQTPPDTPAPHRHDDARCCLWHVGPALAATPVFAAAQIVFAERAAPVSRPAAEPPPIHAPGAAQPRGPPART